MKIGVVAGLIYKDGKILIAKRNNGDDLIYGKWEFPGGKIEADESDEEALIREVREEFNIGITVDKHITNMIYEYPTKVIDMRFYKCSYVDGIIDLSDHFDYKWIDLSEILSYELLPLDYKLAKYILEDNIL